MLKLSTDMLIGEGVALLAAVTLEGVNPTLWARLTSVVLV